MLLMGLCATAVEAGTFDLCSYTRYCGFCSSECPKCKADCQNPDVTRRPPNCKYCPWCNVCPICGTAKSVCTTLGSWVDWASNALASKHAADAENAPGHEAIAEDLRKAGIKPDEL